MTESWQPIRNPSYESDKLLPSHYSTHYTPILQTPKGWEDGGGYWDEHKVGNLRRILTELVGTFILVFIHSGIALKHNLNPEKIDDTGVAIAQGATSIGIIYAFGQVSGAHFNPCVTLAFALRRDLGLSMVPFYWAAQFIGSLLAAAVLYGYFGNAGELGANTPFHDLTLFSAVSFEGILTFILLLVILGTATRGHVIGAQSALAVGATNIFLIFFGRTVGVGSMNPARSFGPALIAGGRPRDLLWIFFAGPCLGSLVATLFIYLISTGSNQHEESLTAGGYGRADVSKRDHEASGAKA